tara:strand:+ start:238 stop:1176 length:939 start_codon:yes stop_codon:yes gene_type:complete
MTHNRVVPWLGVALVSISLFLPYISFLIFDMTGIRIIEILVELLNTDVLISEGTSEPTDVDSSGNMSGSYFAFIIAQLMLILSPIFFSLSAVISAFILLMNKSTRVIGIIHLAYTIVFLILAMLSSSFFGIDIFNFLGIGFYIGAFSSICIFVYNPPSRGNYRSRIPSHMSHDFEEEYEKEAEFPIWLIFFVPVSVITLIALFLIVPFMIFILALSLLVGVMLILKISSSEDEGDFSEEDIVEYKQSIYQDSKTSTGETLRVESKDHYVKDWEELPQGEWLETDANGTHWYQTHNGIIWYSTEEGYRVWEES